MTLIGAVVAALAVLLAAAIVEAMPQLVVAAQGGMGIGSALLLAKTVQLAALALGALGAALLVARGDPWSATLGGAGLLFCGVATLRLEHDAGVGSLLISHGLSGAGLGAIMSVAFVRAAEDRSNRVLVIALLLLAAVAGRAVVGTLVAWGPGSLLLLAAAVAIPSVGMILRPTSKTAEAGLHEGHAPRTLVPLVSAPALCVAGLAVAVGFVAVVAGADANLVLVTLLLMPFGLQQLDMLHIWRPIFLVGGIGLAAVGGAIVQRRQRFSPEVGRALIAIAAAAVMTGSAVAAVRMASAIGVTHSRSGSVALVDLTALVATAVGLLLGAGVLRLGGSRRMLSVGGVIVLASGSALTLGWLVWPSLRSGPWMHPAVLAGWVGTGAGLVSIVLRVTLAEAARSERILAVVGGLIASALFAGLGAVVGTAGSLPVISGDPIATLVASVGTVITAAGLVGLLRGVQPAIGASTGMAHLPK